MLDRQQFVALIGDAYKARVEGNKEALARHWAEGAHFEIAGDQDLLPGVPLVATAPMNAVSKLIDRFTFSDLEMIDAVVEGQKAVVRWGVTIAVEGRGTSANPTDGSHPGRYRGKDIILRPVRGHCLVRHLAADADAVAADALTLARRICFRGVITKPQ